MQVSYDRLKSALKSPSGKLTISPELQILEPTDPTAILLQTDQITKLSESLRNRAKANAAFLSCSIPSLRTFASEQEEFRGSFPGPIPVIYCASSISISYDFKEIADAGAEGVLVPMLQTNDDDESESQSTIINSVQDLLSKEEEISKSFDAFYQQAQEHGLQCIPEITLSGSSTWSEDDIESIVDFITKHCSSSPVAIVISMHDNVQKSKKDDNDEEETILNLPSIPKALSKKLPILGSVRVLAGDNRISWYTSHLKESQFTGAFLRSDCISRALSIDLEQVSKFWSACISDLKTTRSKNFGFRAKINTMLERDVPMEWYNLQKSVIESGALGEDPGESMAAGGDFNPDAGDFQGF